MQAEQTGPVAAATPPPAAAVLELRVHGVNNTTAPALLDLRPQDVELVAGDKLGSFWRPTAAALSALMQGQRGYVPPGIVREAYSWGGMVRTTPDLGSAGPAGVAASAVARVFYAMILPFSIANAAQWSWRLPAARSDERGVRRFAAATRLFGLLLTLLFTCTAVAVALDIGALQCAAAPRLCGPVADLAAPLARWTPGQRLALFALAPAAAVGALWLLSVVSRLRYEVLPGMAGDPAAEAPEARRDAAAPTALLAHPGFWAHRRSSTLARLHFAAGMLLTTLLTAAHAAMAWHTTCTGLGIDGTCVGAATSSVSFWVFAVPAVLAAAGLLGAGVLTVVAPTTALAAEPGDGRPGDAASRGVLYGALALFLIVLVALVFADAAPAAASGPTRLYGAGATPLVIVSAAALVAVSGVAWRPVAGRRHAAWHGCGPAVFLTMALALATALSAIVVVTTGNLINGTPGAAALVRDAEATGPSAALVVSSCWVALGATALVGLIVGLGGVLAAAAARRDVTERAQEWGAPGGPGAIDVPPGGVLPPSPTTLFARIATARANAARAHLVEPLVGVVTGCLGLALLAGTVWSWAAYLRGTSLWSTLPVVPDGTVRTFLAVSLPVLAWTGAGAVAVLAIGAATTRNRPLGLVWDIVCYLPRTGHPFGPPSYAERAVPEIAGRLVAWLDAAPERRAVLAAHSMGGVLAVSALGLLAGAPATRPALARISLLTFGVQLRAYFGRMLPELLGPAALGTEPALAPRVRDTDPWQADYLAQGGTTATEPASHAVGRLAGNLVPGGVAWLSLWRPTDYLGLPAVSTARADPSRGFRNDVDRVAEELDLSGYMVEVGTHSEYYRTPAYAQAVDDLLDRRPE